MLESDFRDYLRDARHSKETTIGSHIANCRRVERYEGDLDQHFDDDQCRNLLWRLTYSAEDHHRQRQPRHNIPINGNVRTGSARLKQAVTHYVQFRRSKGTLVRVDENDSPAHREGVAATTLYSRAQQRFPRARERREADPHMSCGCLITGMLWMLFFVGLFIAYVFL